MARRMPDLTTDAEAGALLANALARDVPCQRLILEVAVAKGATGRTAKVGGAPFIDLP